MLGQFNKNLISKPWFHSKHRVLIAISGGIDSVVLAHLFYKAGYTFGLAHCNFKLRGAESDEDEKFVQDLATQLTVPFYHTSFETTQLANKNKRSIQMEARELRYNWLEKLRQREHFDWIATAHHLNDSIETLFYNFAKGCGIHGLQGIPEQNGYIIRPLLFASKEDIQGYQKASALSFREDFSNASDKYARNKIRQHLIPVLESINPRFIQTAKENISRLQDATTLMDQTIQELKKQFVIRKEEDILIQKKELRALPAINTLLYEWLKEYGFNGQQIHQLLAIKSGTAGSVFYSQTHQLLVDRSHYIVRALDKNFNPKEHYILDWKGSSQIVSSGQFFLEKNTELPESFPDNANRAFLQLGQEAFPLTLRHWQAGDSFQPLGMKGKHQKLQDFFTHQKVTRFEKSRIWIVETKQGEICWIVGHRIDERFKLRSDTKHFISLTYLPHDK